MPWSKLDDELLDHRKVARAACLIGKNGSVIAIGMYAIALMWSNKHLTDGELPLADVKTFGRFAAQPLAVAEALATSGLWDKTDTGFRIHDFHDHNFPAAQVKERRKHIHNVRSVAGKNGAAARWQNG